MWSSAVFSSRIKAKIITTYSKFLIQGNGLGYFLFKKKSYMILRTKQWIWEVVDEIVNRGSIIGSATTWRLGLTDRCLNLGREQEIFFFCKRPDPFWDPPILLYNGYRGSSLETKRPELEFTTHLQLFPRLRMRTAITLQFSVCLHKEYIFF
jgi:hypothetical protein